MIPPCRSRLLLFLLVAWLVVACTTQPSTPTTTPAEEIAPTETVPPESAPTPTDSPDPAISRTILATLAERGDSPLLLDALARTRLDLELALGEPLTFFAPTDKALASLPPEALEDTALLREILLYHIAPELKTVYGDLLAQKPSDPDEKTLLLEVRTMQQERIVTMAAIADEYKVNHVAIVEEDVKATNGVIHIIDGVLLAVAPTVPPEPSDMDPSYESWIPYNLGEPLPIGDAELVPGDPVSRKGARELQEILLRNQTTLNFARAVRLAEGEQVVHVVPTSRLQGEFPTPIRFQQFQSVILGLIVVEGPSDLPLEAGSYLEQLVFDATGVARIDLIDAKGEVVFSHRDVVLEQTATFEEIPTAAIYYGSMNCLAKVGTTTVCRRCTFLEIITFAPRC